MSDARQREIWRRASAKYKRKNLEMIRTKDISETRKYYATHREDILRAKKIEYQNSTDKMKARYLAKRYVVLKQPCESCGGKATDRHHPDYSKPFFVMSLCKVCHKAQHRREGKL